MGNYTKLVTNGTGVYCTTAQEDNATGEALVRAALHKRVDFNRVIVMRTASDFDREWPGEAATTNLFWADQGAFEPAIENIYRAGIKVVNGILDGWNSTFAKGMNASNYIGDIFGTLGGTPNFGPYTSNDSKSHFVTLRDVNHLTLLTVCRSCYLQTRHQATSEARSECTR